MTAKPAKAPKTSDKSALERVGMSFYEEDLKALRDLRGLLLEHGLDLSARVIVRGLIHCASDGEIFAHTLARAKAEAAGKVGAKGSVAEFTNFDLLVTDLGRFQRIGFELEKEGVKGGRTFITRALLHADWDPKKLVRDLTKFREEFPDARTREVRAQRGRG